MARPVNADADATRQRILDSAMVLFAEHGPRGGSVRQIASDAGVSLAMVHHYYGSKDGLYRACVDTMYEELSDLQHELARALSAGPNADLLEQAVRRAFRFARAHRTAMRMMLREVVEAGQLDPRRQERFQGPFLSQAAALVSALVGRPAGELRLPIQTLVFTVSRYAISADRELRLVSGLDDPAAALAAAESHVVDVARSLLGVGGAPG